MSIEYIIITHKESKEIIYYKTAGNFDPKFLDTLRSSIQFEILDLPLDQGEIERTTLEGKYLITRSGKLIWITLILNKLPTLFTREVLKFFCELFENQFSREISDLYTKFQGDISIFRMKSKPRESAEAIIQDVFHLYLALPFKMGSTKRKKCSSNSKKIIEFIKALVQKTQGEIFLEQVFIETSESSKIPTEEIAEIILELVQKEILLPIHPNQV
ncbi:MAG: hypothetical protein ACW990_04205 [Promethearchaeota archaeon]